MPPKRMKTDNIIKGNLGRRVVNHTGRNLPF